MGGEAEGRPQKGLFSLPFMVRAQQRKQQAAQQEAAGVLRELQQEEARAGSEDGPGE